MDADLDTLATALYVRIDDMLKAAPEQAPRRPVIGIAPVLSDAEAVTLAVLQALLGHVGEARWLRFARGHLRHLFPCLPGQPGYNKRLRKLAATMSWLIGMLAATPRCGPMMFRWSALPRWSAAGPGRPRAGPTGLAGPSTATAPRTRATSGDCGCTCCARCRGCPSASR